MAVNTVKADEHLMDILPIQVRDKFSHMRGTYEEIDQRVRFAVTERPLLTVFGALVGGYFLGRLMARR